MCPRSRPHPYALPFILFFPMIPSVPPGAFHLQAYPGATTCVAIGHLTAEAVRRLPRSRALFWITPCSNEPAPALPAGTMLTRVSSGDPAAVVAELERFLRLDARHLPSVAVTGPDYPHLHPLVATVTSLLEQHHRARVTRQRDGFLWQRHVLENLPAYLRQPLPATWHHRLLHRPAVVCGAGPSLDVSAPRLAAMAGRVIIFAADSALHTLARHGITADFVISIDAAKEPAKCLPAGRLPAHAILSPVSPPAWLDAVPAGSCHFVASHQVTTDWIASHGAVRPPLAVAENCGATALMLARWLGCRPLYLFGLDLALAPGAQRHTTGADAALYTGSGFDAAQDYPAVPGNCTDTVPTHVIGDWRQLDERLAGWPAGLVFNVNDRGARLRNTTLVPPGQFVVDGPADKAGWMAELDRTPAGSGELPGAAALARLRQAGTRCTQALPSLRDALRLGGPAALVPPLRQLARDETVARALGAYTLKLMPHLLPPIEGDRAFWSTQLDELAELAALAERCG